jgi:hypothetical protein
VTARPGQSQERDADRGGVGESRQIQVSSDASIRLGLCPAAVTEQHVVGAVDVGRRITVDHGTADRGEAVRMDERSTKVGELLHEAAETHHQVFRITDGADDDWASWYAQWLVTLSELPELLGAKVVRSELTYLLVRLDKEYTERRPGEPWEDYYARELVGHFSPS